MTVNATIESEELTGAWRMDRIMEVYPAAHRALAETMDIRRNADDGASGAFVRGSPGRLCLTAAASAAGS